MLGQRVPRDKNSPLTQRNLEKKYNFYRMLTPFSR